MTDLIKPREKEPEQIEMEKIKSELVSLNEKRKGFYAEQERIKANLKALGPGKTEEKLREKNLYEQREWDAKIKAISKLIESKESEVTKLQRALHR